MNVDKVIDSLKITRNALDSCLQESYECGELIVAYNDAIHILKADIPARLREWKRVVSGGLTSSDAGRYYDEEVAKLLADLEGEGK